MEDTYIGRRQAKLAHWVPYNQSWSSVCGKIAMRGEVGIIGHGGDRGKYWKRLVTHWKRHHRRDDEGTGTGAVQWNYSIAITGGRRKAITRQ